MLPEVFIDSPRGVLIEQLVADHISVSTITPFAEVCRCLGENPELGLLPVVDDGKLQGVIDAASLANGIAHHAPDNGLSLDAGRLMRRVFDSVAVGTPLKELLEAVMRNPAKALTDTLLLVDGSGQYRGRVRLVSAYRYLQVLSRHHLTRYCHPLTDLPGQVMVDNHIDRLLDSNQLFVVTYWDINNFKAFNDHYGYDQGDKVLQELVTLLQSRLNSDLDLLGHINGDKFVLVFRHADWFEHCEDIQLEFCHLAARYYSEEDRERNGIEMRDNSGRRHFHPLITLSVGAVQVEPGRFRSHREVMRAAHDAKLRAKSIQGGGFYLDDYSAIGGEFVGFSVERAHH